MPFLERLAFSTVVVVERIRYRVALPTFGRKRSDRPQMVINSTLMVFGKKKMMEKSVDKSGNYTKSIPFFAVDGETAML